MTPALMLRERVLESVMESTDRGDGSRRVRAPLVVLLALVSVVGVFYGSRQLTAPGPDEDLARAEDRLRVVQLPSSFEDVTDRTDCPGWRCLRADTPLRPSAEEVVEALGTAGFRAGSIACDESSTGACETVVRMGQAVIAVAVVWDGTAPGRTLTMISRPVLP